VEFSIVPSDDCRPAFGAGLKARTTTEADGTCGIVIAASVEPGTYGVFGRVAGDSTSVRTGAVRFTEDWGREEPRDRLRMDFVVERIEAAVAGSVCGDAAGVGLSGGDGIEATLVPADAGR
jgi:hypothetical protein